MFGAAATAAALGRLELSIALAKYAVERDPVSAIGLANLGLFYYRAGQHEQAIDALRAMLNLSSDFLGGRFMLGLAQMMNGEAEAALQSMDMELDEGWRLLGMGVVYCETDQQTDAEEIYAELTEKFALDSAYNIAYVAAVCGWTDRAFEWLDRAVAQNDPGLTDLVVEPLFNNIHADPRWLPFLERIGRSPDQLAAIEFNVTPPE